ncbi:MAG: hypothetical protein WC822_06195 [Candidatus Paceibacterota bacterium]|jgi:hypothetical protein
MINQQLLDFIKHQLQVGLTKEKISNDLLINGWTLQDIEEGFKAVIVPTSTVTPPISPYSGASYIQNTNPVKTTEIQQQTFQPQTQQLSTQQIQVSNSNTTHPFVKNGLIIGIVGFLFFIFTFLISNLGKVSFSSLIYLVLFEIIFTIVTIFCTMLSAKATKSFNRTFIKAFSFSGIMGFFSSVIYLINTYLKVPNYVLIVISLTGIIFTLFFLKKIYSISVLRAFLLWLFSSIIVGIIGVILFFVIGFSFLLSLFGSLKNQTANYTNSIQQPITTQDQTQQTEQNNESQVLPDNINNSTSPNQQNYSKYTNPTYKYSLNYPMGWKINNTNNDSISFSLNESFPPENLEIYASASGYNLATSENFLKGRNVVYQKTTITIGGILSTKLTYDDDQNTGIVSHRRLIDLYIPQKGKNGGELVITGICGTFGTKNSDKKCSTAIDNIMNDIVFPSISFR